jgi:hypothetical protein
MVDDDDGCRCVQIIVTQQAGWQPSRSVRFVATTTNGQFRVEPPVGLDSQHVGIVSIANIVCTMCRLTTSICNLMVLGGVACRS